MHVEIIKRPSATANVPATLRLSINIDAARYGRYYGRALPGFRPAFPIIFSEFSPSNPIQPTPAEKYRSPHRNRSHLIDPRLSLNNNNFGYRRIIHRWVCRYHNRYRYPTPRVISMEKEKVGEDIYQIPFVRNYSDSRRRNRIDLVRFLSKFLYSRSRDTARKRSFRLLIGREGVRVDILPALCHSRDAGFPRGEVWKGGRGVRESTTARVGRFGGAGVGAAAGVRGWVRAKGA